MQLEINGKVVGTKFNNYAAEHFVSVKGNGSSYHFLIAAIWSSYLGWCFVRQKDVNWVEPVLTFEEISDWVDNATGDDIRTEQIKTIQQEMYDSQSYIRLIKKAAEIDEKKSELTDGTTSINTPGEL